MVLIAGGVAASIAFVIWLKSWAARNARGHGYLWMSERWLAEQRVSRSA